MLEYGACTQKLFDYHTDRLANQEYFEVKLVDGFLDDNTTHGLYLKNQEVTISTDFEEFVCWEVNGKYYSKDKTTDYIITTDSSFVARDISEGLEYQLINDDTEYEVKSIGSCKDVNIIIPYTYNDLPVTSIGNSAFSNSSIESVAMSNNIIKIENFAFSGCEELTNVICSSDLEVIKDNAFYECSSLINIDLGESLLSIGIEAFSGCTAIKQINLPETTEFININAFEYCSSLEYMIIPSAVVDINSGTFSECTSLKYVILEEGISNLYTEAFTGCDALEKVVLPKSLETAINTNTFADCDNLHSILFLGNESEYKSLIGKWSALNNYDVYLYSEDLQNDLDYCWHYYNNEPKTWVSNKIKYYLNELSFEYSIYSEAKDYIDIIFDEYLIIPNTHKYDGEILPVTSIQSQGFYNGYGFKTLIIPDNIVNIETSAFEMCYDMENLIIGNGVKNIKMFAFNLCQSLTSIVMGSGVESIGQSAFSHCNGLQKIYYVGSVNDWENIIIGSNNDDLYDATLYFYSETEPISEGNYWHYVDGVVIEW